MAYFISRHVKFALFMALLVSSNSAIAQVSLIEDLLNKLKNHSNFSYHSLSKRRDISADTVIAMNKELFLKVPTDKQFGYYYSIETDHKTETFHRTDLYSGNGIEVLSHTDTTFFAEKVPSAYSRSLIGSFDFIITRYTKTPFPIKIFPDTVINGVVNLHIVANVIDTIENNEHLFSRRDYYINRQTGLPTFLTIKGRYKYNNAINDFYDEATYFNYKFDQPEVTSNSFAKPTNFRPRKNSSSKLTLLNSGTSAPDWTLYDVDGKKVSLSKMKGKVVVLDFYFIGCAGCMLSLEPLNKIYEKYKNQDVVIASLTAKDSKKAVLDFEKRYKIKYPGFVNAADAVKAYNVTAFPTYYFIDREGKIASHFEGYDDDFEQKVTANIDKLLK